MTLWLQWQKQFEDAKEPNLTKIHNNLLNQIEGNISQNECNQVAEAFNQIIRSTSFEEFAPQLLESVVAGSNISEDDVGEIDFKRKGSFGLTSSKYREAWGNFYRQSKTMSDEDKKKQLENPGSDLYKLRSEALSITGKLNHLKGQVLESFLKAMKGITAEIAIDVGSEGASKILSTLIEAKIPNINITGGEDIAKTQGAQSQSVEVIIGDQYIKTISSQGKVDETVPSPFSHGTDWFISAKNYSGLRDIHLLGEGSIVGLLSQGMNQKDNKYIYNAFSIPSSPWTSAHLDQIKKIFAIQALSGQKADDDKANVMVLSINNLKNPIRIISIKALLNKIFEDNNTNAFKFTPALESIIPTGNQAPRKEGIFGKVADLTTTVTLNKACLTLSYLRTI